MQPEARSANPAAVLGRPLEVAARAGPEAGSVRIAAVVPCYNRPGDLALLLEDLGRLDLGRGSIELTIVVVDNASEPPLKPAAPPMLDVRRLTLQANTGGSGGFNAGMAWAIEQLGPDLIWVLDSDARVEPPTLTALVEALEADPGLAAAGSVLVDPRDGGVFEAGGRVNRLTGSFEPAPGRRDDGPPVRVDYVAACSALVRREAVERTGLMPDVFLNADDVQWFVRMREATGMAVAAAPASRAWHPAFDRFQTWARYYIARNALGPIDALGLGRGVRWVRGMREAVRAGLQEMMGRPDMARLHTQGMRDALAGRLTGPNPMAHSAPEPARGFAQLGEDLRERLGPRARRATLAVLPDLGLPESVQGVLSEQLASAGLNRQREARWDRLGWQRPLAVRLAWTAVRVLLGPRVDVAVVPTRGRPATWIAARLTVQVMQQGYRIDACGRWTGAGRVLAAGETGAAAAWLAVRAACKPRGYFAVAPPPCPSAPRAGARELEPGLLSIVILSYNRPEALERTLEGLERIAPGAEVVVVDNASTDGTARSAPKRFARVRLIELGSNIGVAGFNRGVEASGGEYVLILDDDACPDAGALEAAIVLLERRPDLGAVALHPRHAGTRESEWPFAHGRGARDDWPVMGCGNLVRRTAWERAGGYEEAFFLYRNDADLAMKLLSLPPDPNAQTGAGVHFNPGWVVWHDSPAGKSLRWFELATRNWVWLAKRHGRGGGEAFLGALLGWAWAHRTAGMSVRAHWRVLRGVAAGVFSIPPPLPAEVRAGRRGGFRSLLGLRLSGARRRGASVAITPASRR